MHANTCYDFSGKTALITGASAGLGAQFARALSKHGARVIVTARRGDRLEALAKELGNAKAICMDVTEASSVKTVFNTLEADGERIDICINNAGVLARTALFEEDNSETFATIMQTNVTGVWHVTQQAAIHMRKHNIKGSIINISSTGGDRASRPNLSAYYASKAAVIRMTQTLCLELSEHHIRINAVLPGVFYTDMNKAVLDDPKVRTLVEEAIPEKRVGQTGDLDGIILYLASNAASSYATGSCFTVDGGLGCSASAQITVPKPDKHTT